MIESLCRAVGDRPVGPQRSVAFVAGFDEAGLTTDVKDGVLLPREGSVRQVFRRGRRPDRDLEILFSDPLAEAPAGFEDRILDRGREWRFQHQLPGFASDACEFLEIIDIQTLEKFLESAAKSVSFQKGLIGVAGRGKTVNGPDALGGQL